MASGLGLLATQAGAQQAPAVTVAEAKTQDLRQTWGFTGRVVSLQGVDIRARVTGFLESVEFVEGQMVNEGDRLYKIEDRAYRAAVNQIDGSIASAQAELKLAQIEVDRKTVLVQREAVAQSELDIATAQHDKIVGQIEALEANRDDAALKLSYTEVTAPFTGIVGLTVPDVGALVDPAGGPLTTLTKLDPISVEFPVASSLYLAYQEEAKKAGSKDKLNVTLTLANGDVYASAGRIDFVSSTVNRGTDTVLMRAIFDNPDSVLLDGALVDLELEGAEPDMVLGIPAQAMQRDQLGYYVMVVDKDKKVEERRIQVNRTAKGQAVIADGLEEGELVITEGVNKVRPGMTVDAAPADGS